jgi:hypothetical protein
MRTLLVAAIAVVISVITTPAAAEAQNHRQERVTFAKGTSSALIKGKLKGEETVDYVLRASAGQTLTVTLSIGMQKCTKNRNEKCTTSV